MWVGSGDFEHTSGNGWESGDFISIFKWNYHEDKRWADFVTVILHRDEIGLTFASTRTRNGKGVDLSDSSEYSRRICGTLWTETRFRASPPRFITKPVS
jgi:hypothetical protein